MINFVKKVTKNLMLISIWWHLAENIYRKVKWKNDFKFFKCLDTACQIRVNYNPTCNKCNHVGSTPAYTLFHKVKFRIKKTLSSILK